MLSSVWRHALRTALLRLERCQTAWTYWLPSPNTPLAVQHWRLFDLCDLDLYTFVRPRSVGLDRGCYGLDVVPSIVACSSTRMAGLMDIPAIARITQEGPQAAGIEPEVMSRGTRFS